MCGREAKRQTYQQSINFGYIRTYITLAVAASTPGIKTVVKVKAGIESGFHIALG